MQGCPLSSLHFALAVEPLANQIRVNYGISGVFIGNMEHKIELYVDDIVLYLMDLDKCLVEIQNSFQGFSTVSGLKVNFTKSEIYFF